MTEHRRNVFSLTDTIELRFKVDNVPWQQSENRSGSTISNIISFCSRKLNVSSQAVQPKVDPPLKLKFVDKVTNECIIVGNERRLEVIMIAFIDENLVDSRVIGRITVNFDIRYVRIERKKCNVIVAGDKTIQIYTVDLKKQSIYQESVYQADQPIVDITTFSENTLLVFNHKYTMILNTQNNRITLKQKIAYQKPRADLNLNVLSVPRMVDKFVNVFFYDQAQVNDEEQLLSLYKCQITQEGHEFRMSPILDVYKINADYLKVMQLHNYDRETFLINLTTQILVIKRHYPIDAGELKYRHENSRLVYLENRNLLHICDTRVEAHTLEVLKNSIRIKSFDCINFIKPEGSTLLTAIGLNDDRFAIFYVPTKNRNSRETKYYVMGTIKSNIKSKLKDLIKRTNDPQEIQDVAQKMGLTKKQIFLELWMQSSKNKKQDFDILLETEDYKTIISQLKSSLRKECIGFKQIQRIEKACLKMLEKQMTSTPTESLIRNYIKCHFLLRKYEVELSIKSRELRASQIGKEQEKKLSLSIQQFQDIRKRHIIKYLVELMKSLHEEPNKERNIDGNSQNKPSVFKNLVAMRYYIDGFKMVLRAIYRDFLRQIITQLTSDDLLSLLKVYPQLLPRKDDAIHEYSQKSGIWANITTLDWSKTIEFEKIQTIDNIQILNGMMKKDWFRWDWLIKHDIMKLKRQEFQKKFVQNREEKIYYVFFDLLFNILKKDDSNLEALVTKVEETYSIPRHLVGKIFLYWELHQFFSRPGVLPGYELRFEQFLPLKQDEIYQLVFSNEKNCKRLILTDIKDIYNSITHHDIYDDSILTYFKAPYSNVADLKYLLNRINNQKMEFHESNQNLYKVLVEAVYYKLRWKNNQPIPIKDVLVYFESIPLYEEELTKLQQIEKIERHVDLLSKLQLDMNMKEFFSKGAEVLRKLAKYYIEAVLPTGTSLKLKRKEQQSGISFMDIMNELTRIRDDLFKESISNHTVLEVVISFALDYDELVPDVQRMINEEGLLKQFDIVDEEKFMERIVHEKVMRAYQVRPVFENHQPFIRSLLQLLPNESLKKKELQAHLDLGLLLSVLDNSPRAPLVISSRFIEKILAKQKISVVNKLDINRIFDLMCAMGYTEGISSLYEVLILKYLEEGEWQQAIKYIGLWNIENNNKSIVFSALLINKIGEELSKQLKNNLVEIIIIKYHQPDELLQIAQQIIDCQEIKKRKQLITNIVLENEAPMDRFFESNELISEQLKLPGGKLAKQRLTEFFDYIRRGDIELQKKEIYYVYYRLLLCEPIRAHELHSKYFQELDISRIQAIFLEIHKNTNNLFNPLEAILFFYKSLIVLFTSNYLAMQFKKLDLFFNLSYEDIEQKYRNILDELPKEMTRINEKEKYMIMKRFKRLYNRKRDVGITEDNYSIEVQEEDDDQMECMSDIKRMAEKSKMYSKIQTKKTINPMRVIEPATPLVTEEDQDQFEGVEQWKQNLQRGFNRSSPITNFKRVHSVTSSVRQNPKVRELGGERGNLSRNSLRLKHSESANNNQSPSKQQQRNQLDEFKSMWSAQNPSQGPISEVSSINSHPVETHQPEKVKKQIIRTFNSTSSRLKARKLENRQESDSPSKDAPITNQYVQPTIYFDKGEQSNGQIKEQHPEQAQPDQKVQKLQTNAQASQEEPHASESLAKESDEPTKIENNESKAEQPLTQPQIVAEDTNQVDVSPLKNNLNTYQASPIKTLEIQKQKNAKEASDKKQYSTGKVISEANPNEAASMSRSQIRRYMEQATQLENIGLQNSRINPPKQEEQPQQEDIIDDRTREIVDAILTSKDYSKLQQQITKQQANELPFLQRIVRIIFKEATFKIFLQVVEKLRAINIKFQSAVRAQNFRVMRNAFRAEMNFDLRLIFTPDILYLSRGPTMDIESNNNLIFDNLKSRIKQLVNDTNLFVISKLMSLSFNFNKSFEFRVQYYYLEEVIRNYLETKYRNEQQAKMALEKIDALLSRLPINMTAQRFGKTMAPLQGSDTEALIRLLNVKNIQIQIFLNILQRKKDSTDGQKFQKEIADCQAEVSRMINEVGLK